MGERIGGMTFTVMSYNIQDGGADRLTTVAGLIRRQQPDAVALLEANSRENVEILARDLRMHLAFGEANSQYHIAWLSNWPVHRVQNHRLPALAKTLLQIDLTIDRAPFHLFATHLASRWDAHNPSEEVAAILNVLRRCAVHPHLLVGDFNTLAPGDVAGIPPHGAVLRADDRDNVLDGAIQQLMNAGYTDCYRALHQQATGYTYPAHHPWLRIDYIFASASLARCLLGCEVIAGEDMGRASDHLPIRADFQLDIALLHG